MLKSALQFRRIILLVFYIVSLGFSARANIIFEEYILFDVSSKIYDLGLIKKSYAKLMGFSCIYPSSLFVKLVGVDESDSWLASATRIDKKLTSTQRSTLDKMIKFYKLINYVQKQRVYMDRSLTRLLKQSYTVNGCTEEGMFAKELMTQSLADMAKLEVMFSKRRQKLSRFDKKKLDESLRFIYSTVDKQITHNYLW